MLVVIVLAACSAKATPAPSNPSVPPASTLPPVVETVVVKETVVVEPTVMPTEAATATITPTVGTTKSVAPKPTSAGKLEFTIEFSPSAPRKGDNKVQLTMILHVTGGAPPFSVQEDENGIFLPVTKRADGVQYTRDWQSCNQGDPHSISVFSGDGQKSTVKTMLPYDQWCK
jgi:hypothetical protein